MKVMFVRFIILFEISKDISIEEIGHIKLTG